MEIHDIGKLWNTISGIDLFCQNCLQDNAEFIQVCNKTILITETSVQ